MLIKSVLVSAYQDFLFIKEREEWRKKNTHNLTTKGTSFDSSIVTVGKGTYGPLNIINSNTTNRITIGNYCSIAQQVTFIINSEHPINHISTYPFKVQTLQSQQYEAISKGDIVVKDDVWIGHGAIINSGVTIGQGAVIASGAVVTKDVRPYAIVGGVPAREISRRFDEETVEKLLKIDYSKLDFEKISNNIDKLYSPVDRNTDIDWINS